MDAGTIIGTLLQGLPMTLLLLVLTMIIGFVLAVVIAILRVTKVPVLSQLAAIYVSFTRSVPIVLLLFLAFYGVPAVLQSLGLDVDTGSIVAAVIGLTWYHSGYLSEVIRPAYLIIDKGQHEAADSLGYTPRQKLVRVIAPQMVPVALPGYGNALIYLIHNTALAHLIGVVDIFGKSDGILAGTSGQITTGIYFTLALIYGVLCLIISGAIRLNEKVTDKFRLGSTVTVRGV
jgi:L-cystine transport system permease protein